MPPELLRFSIVIPTFNRQSLLERTIQGLLRQTESVSNGEVIVVDNGSKDSTVEWLKAQQKSLPFPLRICQQSTRGSTAARNMGIQNARGEILILLDDDVCPEPAWLAAHLEAHCRHGEVETAILGRLIIDPALRKNRYYDFLEDMFGFWALHDGQELDFSHMVAANVSFKRRFLTADTLFDENFHLYYEDYEWALRLAKKGLRLVYSEQATGSHWLCYSSRQALTQRWIVGGLSIHHLEQKYGRSAVQQLFNSKELEGPLWKRLLKWGIWYLPAYLCRWVPKRLQMVSYCFTQQFFIRQGYLSPIRTAPETVQLFDAAQVSRESNKRWR